MRSYFVIPFACTLLAIPFAFRSSAVAQSAPPVMVQNIYPEIPVVPFETYCRLATDCVEFEIGESEAAYSACGIVCTRYKAKFISSARNVIQSDFFLYVGGSELTNPIVRVSGAPKFQLGERVIAFIHTDATNQERSLLGLEQGTYRLELEQGNPESTRVTGLHALAKESPAQFLARVHEIVNGQN